MQKLDISLSLTLPYPVRNSLPFTSLRSVTVDSGRDFLEGDTYEGQAQGLLERWLDPHPVVAAVGAHGDQGTVEVQDVRGEAEQWAST